MGPLLVLLKGHPCSGKSTFAKKLAKELSCALIDKDDAKSVLVQELSAIVDDAVLNELSYKLMVQSVRTHMATGLICIVDCPLAKKALFDQLHSICTQFHGRVALIECVAKDHQIWRHRVEQRAQGLRGTPDQHKAFTWDELLQLIKQYIVFLLAYKLRMSGIRYDGCWRWPEELASGVLAYHRLLDTTSDDQHTLHNEVARALRKCNGQ